MRRLAPCMILLLVPGLALASAGGYPDPDRGTCLDTPEQAGHAAPGDATGNASRATPPPAHAPATSQGGGGGDELLLPRVRMPRWHSFLPGMFR